MYKVLLVDDEILVREAIGENIKWNELGFELAKVCENGKEAIEYLKDNPVDVVLTDICMPHVDGMELSKFVYETYPRTAIIIFSGYGEFEYAKQAIKYKVSEYILKPVTARELSDILMRLHEKMDGERAQEEKIDKLSRAYRKYTQNEAIIISKALSHLVKGTQEVQESIRELQELGISVEGEHYRVAVLDLDIYSDLYEIDESQKKENALMAFVVENVSNEIVGNYNSGIAYKDNDNRVCLLLHTNKPREFRNTAEKICEEISEIVYETMKLSLSIGLGQYVENLSELYLSYESAVDVLKYRYTKGGSFMYDCEKHQGNPETPIDFEEALKRLVHGLKSADLQAVEDVLDDVVKMIVQGYVSQSSAVSYLHRVLRSIRAIVAETGGSLELDDSLITEVSCAKNFGQAMKTVTSYAREAVECMHEISQSSGSRQAALAIDYLKANYGNQDISLNSICSYLNISTSHFSNIFKEATGETFTEVLTNIRIEKAKQLLKETSLRNYEIAERVGFSDPHYFSIAFKKMTGKTPKEYAKES